MPRFKTGTRVEIQKPLVGYKRIFQDTCTVASGIPVETLGVEGAEEISAGKIASICDYHSYVCFYQLDFGDRKLWVAEEEVEEQATKANSMEGSYEYNPLPHSFTPGLYVDEEFPLQTLFVFEEGIPSEPGQYLFLVEGKKITIGRIFVPDGLASDRAPQYATLNWQLRSLKFQPEIIKGYCKLENWYGESPGVK